MSEKIGTLDVTTPSDREVAMTRAFDAPRRLVFDAYTKPDLVRRWLLGPEGWSMPVCEIELRVGGAIRYVWRHSDGRRIRHARRLSRDRRAGAARARPSCSTRTGPAARRW